MATDQYGTRLPEGTVARLGTPRPVRQGERISSLVYSPDGKTMVTGGEDGVVRHWDLARWREIRRLGEHGKQVGAVAFSHDGMVVASGSHDGLVALWDVTDGSELRSFHTPAAVIGFFFLDEHTLLTIGGDETYRAYDLVAGEEVLTDATHLGLVNAVSLTADGQSVAIATWESIVRICSFVSGQEERQFGGHRAAVQSVAFSPDGRNLASASVDETVRLWELTTGKERFQIPNRKDGVFALAFGPDGHTLATANHDSTVLLWDLTFKPPVKTPGARPAAPLTVAQLEPLWQELGGNDAFIAYQAAWMIAHNAKQMVPHLKNRLKTLVPADRQRVTVLLTELSNDQIARRDKAQQELEKIGALCEPMLRTALQKPPSMDARRRLERLLEKALSPLPSADALHVLRAVEALEMANTVESRQVLGILTGDALPPRIVQEATAALGRLEGRPPLPG